MSRFADSRSARGWGWRRTMECRYSPTPRPPSSRSGDWVEAGQLVEQAGRLHPHELASIDLHLARARLLVAQGRDEAGHTISALRGMLCATIDPQYNAPVRVTEAELALWSGDAEAARNAVAAGLDHLQGTDDAWFAGPLLSLGARAEADRAQHARDRHDLASAAAAGANAARLCERAFAIRGHAGADVAAEDRRTHRTVRGGGGAGAR